MLNDVESEICCCLKTEEEVLQRNTLYLNFIKEIEDFEGKRNFLDNLNFINEIEDFMDNPNFINEIEDFEGKSNVLDYFNEDEKENGNNIFQDIFKVKQNFLLNSTKMKMKKIYPKII